jgi:hypothetical protein
VQRLHRLLDWCHGVEAMDQVEVDVVGERPGDAT